MQWKKEREREAKRESWEREGMAEQGEEEKWEENGGAEKRTSLGRRGKYRWKKKRKIIKDENEMKKTRNNGHRRQLFSSIHTGNDIKKTDSTTTNINTSPPKIRLNIRERKTKTKDKHTQKEALT